MANRHTRGPDLDPNSKRFVYNQKWKFPRTCVLEYFVVKHLCTINFFNLFYRQGERCSPDPRHIHGGRCARAIRISHCGVGGGGGGGGSGGGRDGGDGSGASPRTASAPTAPSPSPGPSPLPPQRPTPPPRWDMRPGLESNILPESSAPWGYAKVQGASAPGKAY